MASDVLYDRRHPALLAAFLQRNLHPGSAALIADPGRPWLQEFVTRMQDDGYEVVTSVEQVSREGAPLDVFLLQVRSVQGTADEPKSSLS